MNNTSIQEFKYQEGDDSLSSQFDEWLMGECDIKITITHVNVVSHGNTLIMIITYNYE